MDRRQEGMLFTFIGVIGISGYTYLITNQVTFPISINSSLLFLGIASIVRAYHLLFIKG